METNSIQEYSQTSEHLLVDPCKNCHHELSGDYCGHCGNAATLKRINGQYILNEIGSVLNFDKGIFYTIKELAIRPGTTVRKFIQEDRNRLVKPLIFIIISSLVYTLFKELLHFEDGYVSVDLEGSEKTAIASIFGWIQNNYGYANILMGMFIAFWIKIVFRKYDYNFYEILILLCFLMGMGMLLYSIFGIIESIIDRKILHIASVIAFIYISWAIGQFFDRRKKRNYIKGLFAYVLGMLTFTLLAVGLGLLLDNITK